MSSPENPFMGTLDGPLFVQEAYIAQDLCGTPQIVPKRQQLIAQALELPLSKVAAGSWLAERVVEEADEEIALAKLAGDFDTGAFYE